MGRLRRARCGRTCELTAEHLVGRSSGALMSLADERVSSHHALVRWTGEGWEVRDLGSRNGTWVAGVRLEGGRVSLLEEGADVLFGGEGERWQVVDITPPVAQAREAEGTWQVAEDGLLQLPSPEDFEVCVHADAEGRWCAERGDLLEVVRDGDVIPTTGRTWRLHLPSVTPRTAHARSSSAPEVDLATCELTFRVSRDEEHVELVARAGEVEVELPHRAHTYLLLILARARLEDHDAAAPGEEGWVYQDDLMRALRMDENHLNVQLFRARGQMERAQLHNAQRIVERRRGSRQVRLGVGAVRVEGL
jgi:hypothetical protein